MCAQDDAITITILFSRSRISRKNTGRVFRTTVLFFQKWLLVSCLILLVGCSSLADRESGEPLSASGINSLPFEIMGFPIPGPFSVERIELNTSKSTNIFQRKEKLMPIATIQYKGSGALVGHWTVDGRILEPFVVHLNRGSSLHMRLKNGLNLAALSSGRHRLSLEFSQPKISFNTPKLEFYVE